MPRLGQLVFQEHHSSLEVVDFLHEVLDQDFFFLALAADLLTLLAELLIAGHRYLCAARVRVRGRLETQVAAVGLVDLDVLAQDRAPAISVSQTLELCVVAEFLMLEHVKVGGRGVAAEGLMRAGEDLETQSRVEGWVWEG